MTYWIKTTSLGLFTKTSRFKGDIEQNVAHIHTNMSHLRTAPYINFRFLSMEEGGATLSKLNLGNFFKTPRAGTNFSNKEHINTKMTSFNCNQNCHFYSARKSRKFYTKIGTIVTSFYGSLVHLLYVRKRREKLCYIYHNFIKKLSFPFVYSLSTKKCKFLRMAR